MSVDLGCAGVCEIQPLEARRLLTTSIFTVTTTAPSGSGSLRQAILDANATSGNDDVVINFNIPVAGVQTIAPLTALPTINVQVDLEGTTDADGNPLIELDGEDGGTSGSGLVFDRTKGTNSDVSQAKNLIIDRFAQSGIVIEGSGQTDVTNCWIGTDATGEKARGNAGDGILVANNDAFITGSDTNPTIISGNNAGIVISGSGVETVIFGCFIGTDLTGTKALGNATFGVEDAGNQMLLGSNVGLPTVISGNGGVGVEIAGSGCYLRGTQIGTNKDGTAAIPNGSNGVELDGATGAQIGGAASDNQAPDLISGNGSSGVAVIGGSDNKIESDMIGTNQDGTAAIPNGVDGVRMTDTVKNTLDSDVISGNSANGVRIEVSNTSSHSNRVFNSFIGTDPTGTVPIGNGIDGVLIESSSSNVVTGNTIAYNGADGVEVLGPAAANLAAPNSIFSNTRLGISLGAHNDVPLPNQPDAGPGNPNDDQPYPFISLAEVIGGHTLIAGALSASPSSEYSLYFYANDVADPSGNGQGQTLIGEEGFVTDSSGSGDFGPFSLAATSFGQFISAVAVNSTSGAKEFDTSEFSPDMQVSGAEITGTVFNDTNGDGVQESKDKGLAKQVVYVDSNGDGKHEASEPEATTNSAGHYRIFGLSPGTVHVRLLVASGYEETTPSPKRPYLKVPVHSFQDAASISFGEEKIAKKTAVVAAMVAPVNVAAMSIDIEDKQQKADEAVLGL